MSHGSETKAHKQGGIKQQESSPERPEVCSWGVDGCLLQTPGGHAPSRGFRGGLLPLLDPGAPGTLGLWLLCLVPASVLT